MIPYGRQDVNLDDIDAVVDVLRSDWLTQGPLVPKFEQLIADYCGVPKAIAVNSATSALHLACLALGLGPGDLGWTTPNSFVASANCIRYCGANVDFVDIDPNTLNISVSSLRQKLVKQRSKGPLPKVLVVVHFSGRSCDMEAIHSLSKEFNFRIIEDASHAIGAKYKNFNIGGCQYSDLTVFSFHPVKIITTGEGGMIVGRDQELMRRIELLRSHGITRDQSEMTGISEGPWYYQQIDLGYNYRMTDMQAALGISQLSRINEILNKRLILANRYSELLSDLPLRLPCLDIFSSWHLYCITVDQIERRKDLFIKMRSANIGVNVHYIPIHMQPYYQRLGFRSGDFPNAEHYYKGAITLPLYPFLTFSEQDYISETLRKNLS